MFQRYVDEGYKIRLILMEHPEVPRLSSYSRCSVVLQRGIIIYEQGRETLYIRSYVHSANEGQDFVNFVPRTGVKFTFDSKMIWFPLETTAVIQEPASYVVIDILTPRPLKSKIAPPFRITRRGPVKLNNRKFQVTRINAKLAAKRTRDLRIKPQ